MKRPGLVWPIFGICIVLAAWALARLGSVALSLERAEATARRQAALEENVQLALWRLDSALAPLMAEESARPYFTYSSLYPAERAFTCMFAEIQRGDVLMPSPLLTFRSPRVCLHFQYDPAGRLSSPQVPAGNMRDLAEARYLSTEQLEHATRRLDALSRMINRRSLAAALDLRAPAAENDRQLAAGPPSRLSTSNEYIMRFRSTKAAQNAAPAEARPLSSRSTLVQGALQAIWIGPTLVLARRVQVEEGTFLQGCWLDWDFLRRDLLNNVSDLVPGARLEPVPTSSTPEATRMLASLPVRLVPGLTVAEAEKHWSPVRLSLWIAWACLLLAAVGFAWVLHGTLALSERRGTFVSAVTHEIRTPL
ncbi:MAG: sensor histidine kinase, partial [Isosphaeraceae bacterium]|nr:sensor histidine kinase [Isosphaeraceae bacterium]